MSKIGASTVLWPAWIVLTLAVTVKPFLWHLEFFRRLGPRIFVAYLGALVLLIGAGFVYIRIRQSKPALVAREPGAFAAFFLAFFLFYAPIPTVYSLWILFVSFGLGRLALGRLAGTPLEELTLFPAAGLGLLSTLLFVLGLARLLYRPLAFVLLALAALVFWRNIPRLRDLLRRAGESYAACASEPVWGLCLVFVLAVGLASAIVALSPEIAFDPVSFHFVLARDYAAHHRLEIVPFFPYSYFPQGVEILYTLGFLLEGQATAKILTYAFFPLAAMSVAMIGRRWFAESRSGALVASALFVTTPFISWTGSVAKNDLALALYLLLALYGVTRWSETKRFGWLAAGILFLGFAFGVKHVAILGAVPLALLVAWSLRRAPISARQWVALAAIFLCAGLYWHTRTFLLTGNPLYPEGGRSAVRSTTAAGHPQLSRFQRVGIYLSVPWRVHFSGLYAYESPSPNPCGFVLVAFLPLLFRRGGARSPAARLVLAFCVAYFLYWAAILIKVRYAIAAFGVLFAYAGDRISAFGADGRPLRRFSVLALAAYCFAFSLSLILILEMNVPRLELFARRISREEFLRQSLVTYRSIEALNRLAQPGERAYSVGNCSTFYSDIEFRCYYDYQGNYSLDQIRGDLETLRYQYLILSANAWADPHHMHVIGALFHPLLIYEDESFRIYRLQRRL